jgi:hypothetical protein
VNGISNGGQFAVFETVGCIWTKEHIVMNGIAVVVVPEVVLEM